MTLDEQKKLHRAFSRFIENHHEKYENELAHAAPGGKRVTLDIEEVKQHDPELTEFLLAQPAKGLQAFSQAGADTDSLPDFPTSSTARVVNLPDERIITVPEFSSKWIAELVGVRGIVRDVSDVEAHVTEGVFMCLRCFATIRQPQERLREFKEPMECYESEGGCGRNTTFRPLLDESMMIQRQELTLEPLADSVPTGVPESVSVIVEGGLCGKVDPPAPLVVNGIVHALMGDAGVKQSTAVQLYIEGISLEKIDGSRYHIPLSEQDEHVERPATMEDLYVLNDREFERLVGHLLEEQGYEVQRTQRSGDYGADIVASLGGKTLVVEVKHHQAPAGNKVVRSALGAMPHHEADHAMVVSLSGYTPAAIKQALNAPIRLWKGEHVIDGLSQGELAQLTR